MEIRQEKLLSTLGPQSSSKIMDRFYRLFYLPDEIVSRLAQLALQEDWGTNQFVLRKYLAVQIEWAIQQGHYTVQENQWYLAAGNLQTRYGTPIYLAVEKNHKSSSPPFAIVYVNDQISAPTLPNAPSIPSYNEIPPGLEIIMSHEHILGDNYSRVEFLDKAPPVAQMCAVAGAIQWSMHRNLFLPYWYFGQMQVVVPLYLNSREDITAAPDVVAPIQLNPRNLLVRTVLLPEMIYANARVAAQRHDQLPPWLNQAWKNAPHRDIDSL